MPLTIGQRRTLARLRLQRMKMKAEGKYITQRPPAPDHSYFTRTDVMTTWRKNGLMVR